MTAAVSRSTAALLVALLAALSLVAAVAAPRSEAAVPAQLLRGQALASGQSLAAGQYTLVMRSDGQLQLKVPGRTVWLSGTAGNPGARLVLQGNGNLVIRSARNTALWHTSTQKTDGYRLRLTASGDLGLYTSASKRLWGTGAEPPFALRVPTDTRQVVRTVRTDRWCSDVYCTVTQTWARSTYGQWRLRASYRSQIGPTGFKDGALRQAGDGTTPVGVYDVATTFSTDSRNPGIDMRWKQRKPTSTVSGSLRWYNTWIEDPATTDGNRSSMRWGLWIGFNNPRLVPDQGPAPDPSKGSGIFMHTMGPTARYKPSRGCVAVGDPAQMKAILFWLDADTNPRIVNGI